MITMEPSDKFDIRTTCSLIQGEVPTKGYGSAGGAEFFEVIEPMAGLAPREFEAAVSRYWMVASYLCSICTCIDLFAPARKFRCSGVRNLGRWSYM